MREVERHRGALQQCMTHPFFSSSAWADPFFAATAEAEEEARAFCRRCCIDQVVRYESMKLLEASVGAPRLNGVSLRTSTSHLLAAP